jgi:hypothetical protein
MVMARIFADVRFRKGLESDGIPVFPEGQPAITSDTKRVFVGSADGNVELAKKESVDPLNTEINNARGGLPALKDRLDGIDSSLADKASQTDLIQRARGFKPTTACFMNRISDEFTEVISSTTTYQGYINVKKQYGLDGFFIVVEIQPSASQQTAFNNGTITESALVYRAFPLISDLITSINMTISSGLKFLGIKAHCKWAYSKWANLTTSFFTAYKNAITDMITSLKNAGISFDYLTILNEAYNIAYNSANSSYIVDILNTVHTAGYKTGVCGMDIDQLPASVIAASDLLSIHVYPPITNKGQTATIDDGVTGWECTRLFEKWTKWYKANPTKEFWVMETGTMNYYESLSLPEAYYGATGTYAPDGSPQQVYFTGMFEYFKKMPFLKGVNLFYLDGDNYHDLLKQMFNRYLRNEV